MVFRIAVREVSTTSKKSTLSDSKPGTGNFVPERLSPQRLEHWNDWNDIYSLIGDYAFFANRSAGYFGRKFFR
jgi:hypothetical protein